MVDKKKDLNKKFDRVKIFRVPFPLEELQENINITTSDTSQTSATSKEEIINQAFKLHSQGNVSEAAKYYHHLIDQGFNDHRVFANYGAILKDHRRLKEAEIFTRKAIQLKPDYSIAHNNLGNILNELYELDKAELSFRAAIKFKPDYAEAYSNLGDLLNQQGKVKEAEVITRKAIDLRPSLAVAYLNLGNILKNLGKLEEAALSTQKAITINPSFSIAHNNLGGILRDLGNLNDAEISTLKAIKLNDNYAEAFSNLGIIQKGMGKTKEAEISLRKAIEIKPDLADAHNNLSHLLLTLKIFKEGWERYEWRWKLNSLKSKSKLKTNNPRWNQEKKGCVLLWGEQGVGDEIQYLSLVPDCIDKIEKLILKLDKRLIPLIKRSIDKSINIISKEDTIDEKEYDYHLPIGSLPMFLRPSLKSFKTAKNFKLVFDKERSNKFREQLLRKKYKKYIGISWKTTSKNSLINSLTLEQLINGIYSKDICFINLQYGDVKDEISNITAKLGVEIQQIDNLDIYNDIDGLASLIGSCDEVVTIGNMTATLSGSLDINTRVILPTNSYWTYGLNDKTSYWFKSMKLYRQEKRNEWDKPLKKIKKEIMI